MLRPNDLMICFLALAVFGCTEAVLDTGPPTTADQASPSMPPLTAFGVTVESPLDGALINRASVDVTGTSTTATEVIVNGVTVAVEEGRFNHPLALPNEGAFTIEVATVGAAEVRTVMVDRSGPTLTVMTPARGAAIERSSGREITVSGTATDPAGVASLTVNGQVVAVGPNGAFSTTVQPSVGTNIVQIEAVDATGAKTGDARAVIYGDFTPFSDPVDDAITVRLERDALDMAAEALGQGISPDLFGNLGGAVQEGNFQVREVTMGQTEIRLEPGQGVLGIELRVYDLQLDFAANFNGSSIRGDIEADPAVIRLDMRLDTDGLGGLDIEIVGAHAEMEDFDFDVNGLLGLFDWIIRGIVRDKLEEGLSDALRGKMIADILEADALNQTGELLGHPAAYAMALTHIGVDPDGIDIALDAGIEVTGEAAGRLPGYFSNPASAPTGSDDGMIRFSLADDFLNMLLAQVWQVSGLQADLGALLDAAEEGAIPLKLDAGSVSSLLGAPELLDYVPVDAKVGLTLKTNAPPLVQVTGGAAPKVQIDVPELELTFSVTLEGQPTTWAVVVIHLGIGLTRDADDALLFDVSSVIDVVDAPLFPISDAQAAGPLGGLFNLLPGLVASGGGEGLLGGLGDLGGMGSANPGVIVENFRLRVGGPDGGYLSFGLDLGVQLVPEEAPGLTIIQTEISPINGRTYHLLEPSNWSEAEAMARSLGGHLATIRSRDEDRWVLNTFGELDRQNRDLWIGLHDARREGELEWTSGEPVDYTNFDRKQPDNGVEERAGTLNEDYVHIYGDRSERRDGRWNDGKDVATADYSEGFHGVVEVFEAPQAPVPEEPEVQ